MIYLKKIFTLLLFVIIIVYAKNDAFSAQESREALYQRLYSSLSKNPEQTKQEIKYYDSLAKANKDKSLLLVIELLQGRILQLEGQYGKSVNKLVTTINELKNNKDLKFVALGNLLLGETYRASAITDKSLETLFEALSQFKDLNDNEGIARTYNRLAAVFFESDKERHKSKEYSHLALEYATKINEQKVIANTYDILGAYYHKIGDRQKALNYFFKALEIANNIVDYNDTPNILNHIALVYLDVQDNANALKYALQSYEISNKLGIIVYQTYSARYVAFAYNGLGKYKEAYDFLYYASSNREKLFHERYSQEIYQMQNRMEMEKKDKEIELNRTISLYQTIVLVVVILLILGLAVGYYFKLKFTKRKNQELEKSEELLREANSQLKELNSTKDKFFSIIAHDLRNPLGSLKVITELLDDNFDMINETDRREFVTEMRFSSKQIYELLENLLTWARSQSGRIEFKPDYINIHFMVASLFNLLNNQASKKNINLISEIDNNLLIWCDPNMLNTVMRNLISNAIKFTNTNGIVKVSAGIIDRKSLENSGINLQKYDKFVEIKVADNGVGISENDINGLFRIDVAKSTIGTSKEKGTGLGLIISKEFIDKHEGIIRVESTQGIGTEFIIVLPLI